MTLRGHIGNTFEHARAVLVTAALLIMVASPRPAWASPTVLQCTQDGSSSIAFTVIFDRDTGAMTVKDLGGADIPRLTVRRMSAELVEFTLDYRSGARFHTSIWPDGTYKTDTNWGGAFTGSCTRASNVF